MEPELFMALLEEKTRKQHWQKQTLKHEQLVLHPSELGIKRLQAWLELGVSGSSGSSVNTEGLTATCPLPAAVNSHSKPGKGSGRQNPQELSREGWEHRNPKAGSAGGLGTQG